jgi:hypothetical protein
MIMVWGAVLVSCDVSVSVVALLILYRQPSSLSSFLKRLNDHPLRLGGNKIIDVKTNF